MTRLKKYLSVLVVSLFLLVPLYSDYYKAEEIEPLLTELENELNELAISNTQKQTKLNELSMKCQNLQNENEQIQNELNEAEALLKKSEQKNTQNNLLAGFVGFVAGLFTFGLVYLTFLIL